jgi:hypothetical protein
VAYNGTMQLNTTSSTIKINLSSGLKKNASFEANRIGISVQDFIRMLLSTYFAKSDAIMAISQDNNLLKNAKQEIKSNNYSIINSSKQLNKHLLKL